MGFNIRSMVRSFGILNNKGVVNVCNETGEKLIQTAQKQCGNINIANVEKSLKETFPAAKNMIISDSYDTFESFMKNMGNYDDEAISMLYNNSLSFVIANAKTKQTLLSLRLKGMEDAVAVNTAVHELEHALLRTNSASSFSGKLQRMFIAEKR